MSDRESKSFLDQMLETPSLFGGESVSALTVKKGSTVQSSEMKADTFPAGSYVRLTRSLITSGLVAGITPSLVRQTSGLAIRDFASLPLALNAVATRSDENS